MPVDAFASYTDERHEYLLRRSRHTEAGMVGTLVVEP
jgi:hypothetical protein